MPSNKTVIIRHARPSDIIHILAIEEACFAYDKFSKRQFTYLLKKAKRLFLAIEKQKKIIGFAIYLLHKARPHARLYALAVKPDYQGKGFASLFLAYSEKKLKKMRYSKIILEVRADAKKTISFYKKFGYTANKTLNNYYQNNRNGIQMIKITGRN